MNLWFWLAGGEESAVINRDQNPKVKIWFFWDTDAGSGGDREDTSPVKVQSSGKYFLRVNKAEAMFQRQSRLYLMLVAQLGNVKVTQVVLVLKV